MSGLQKAFTDIRQVLDAIPTLPDCDLEPQDPETSAFPALYFFWDNEKRQIDGGDLKWINPLNSRAWFKVHLYLKKEKNIDMPISLFAASLLIIAAITSATAVSNDWKGNVTETQPIYGSGDNHGNPAWAGLVITIEVGEYE